jgi:SP family arabinose:H+ symporter-like MFS transporter
MTPAPLPNTPQPQSRLGYAFLVAFVAAFGGFLFGYDLAVITGAQIFLRDEFGLAPKAYGFATSSALLGCIIGPFVGSWLCDRIGRKRTLIFAGFLFGASAFGTAMPVAIESLGISRIMFFNIFRIVGGVGVGLASLASPMYIAEIAPARYRGRMGLMYQLAITVGSTFALFLAWRLAPTQNWQWMFGSEIFPIILFIGFLVAVPYSPRWLAEKGRHEEALAVLTKIDGPVYARAEMDEIEESLKQESGTFAELFQPGIRKALLCAVLLAIFNNLTGWSVIAYYLSDIFNRAGFDPSGAILRAMFMNGGNIILTLVAIYLVDRLGRRPLWNLTALAMAAAMIFAAMAFQWNWTGALIVAVVFVSAIPHAIGLGPLPWLMMSELFPTRIRAKGVAISTTFVWIAGFTGPMFFPILGEISTKKFGSISGVFVLLAGMCLLALLFGWKLLPETKNRTLEDIAQGWTRKTGTAAAPSLAQADKH